MIIVLKDADFSANNIGTVEIPYELSPQTKELLTHLTKYGENSSQARKLDVFLKSLNSASFKNKIKVLCLPAFGLNLTQCFYNIIDGESISPQTTDIYEIRTKGYGIKENLDLSDKNTDDRYSLGLIPEKLGFVSDDTFELSAGVYIADSITQQSQQIFGLLQGPYITQTMNFVVVGANGTDNLVVSGDPNQVGSIGLRSFSYKGNDFLINYCGLIGTGTVPGETWNPATKFGRDGRVQFCGYSINGTVHTKTVSFMFLGTFMTQNELNTLNDMVTNLLSFITEQ